MQRSERVLALVLALLCLLCSAVWYVAVVEDRSGKLTVSYLDVGHGDAIFIDAPSGRQVLIDGGPNASVLARLAQVSPWWDRTIDVMIPTHPDADHISGLADVLGRYRVDMIVRSSVEGDTHTFDAFNKAVEAERARVVTAMRGQVIDLGAGAYLEVLFPDRSVPHVDTNDGSVVVRLVYGDTSFLFTGDAPQGVEEYLVYLDGEQLRSDVLKAGHHGSKTASSPLFVGLVDPGHGVFSRGCDNRYGHPSPEVVERFRSLGIPTLDTCAEGTVSFVSDGQTVHLR